TARTAGGLTNFLVPADTAGMTVTPIHGLDVTRRYASVAFAGAAVPASAVVGEVDGAGPLTEELFNAAAALQCCEVGGSMDRCFEITLECTFNRYSFGRPLASYQELKHRCADMKAWLETAHAISDAAIAHVQDQSDRAAEYVSAAKAFLADYGPELAHDCV